MKSGIKKKRPPLGAASMLTLKITKREFQQPFLFTLSATRLEPIFRNFHAAHLLPKASPVDVGL